MEEKQRLILKRNNNGVGAPQGHGTHAVVSDVLEMAALDDLGPLTRCAIANAPLKLLAYTITSQIVEVNDKIEEKNRELAAAGQPQRQYIDPKHPELDRRLAMGVVENTVNMILKDEELGDNAQEWARMAAKPLIPKLTPKTHRERKKTERRFRGW